MNTFLLRTYEWDISTDIRFPRFGWCYLDNRDGAHSIASSQSHTESKRAEINGQFTFDPEVGKFAGKD